MALFYFASRCPDRRNGRYGLLIHYATHLPFGVVFFVINLPFYWLSVRRMGAAFTLKTFCAVGLVSLFSDLHGYLSMSIA